MLNRGRNIEKGRVITRRMFILAAAKILLFAGISSRLYNLQISDREKYEILSDKNRIKPKNRVVHAIISIFLKRLIISVEYIIYPKIVRGIEPTKIRTNNFWLFLIFSKSSLK